jgi:hypothetical protein
VRIAPERMAVVKGTRVEEIMPYEEAKTTDRQILTDVRGRLAKERILKAGTIYLENDRRERKATGSYYTPDYIVKYIVQNTVGPVMDEKLAALRPQMQKVAHEFNQIIRHKIEVENVKNPNEFAILQNTFGGTLQQMFDIKILDPAMGSGHFLVEAVDYVTDRLVQFLDGFPFISTFFDGMKAAILEEMQDQRVTINPDRLTDVTLLKRHVLKRCVYGVDLNPMAVELAKLSLWLDCFTMGAPLSFLDHHLRCGNSLIGAMAQDVEESLEQNGQMTLLTGPFTGLLQAAEIMRGVSQITDVTVGQVSESRHMFKAFDEAAKPFKQLLDVYIAKQLGFKRAEEFLSVYSQDKAINILREKTPTKDRYLNLLKKTKKLYLEKKIFHWDLEFPEVYIDLEKTVWKTNGGFDVVIGNPPYERKKEFEDFKEHYKNTYESAYGSYDIYVLFIERALKLVRIGNEIGFIVSNKFLVSDYGQNIRNILFDQHQIRQIIDFTECPSSFPDVLVSPIIFIVSKGKLSDNETLVSIFQKDDIKLLQKIPTSSSEPTKISDSEIIIDFRKQIDLYDEVTGHINIYLVGIKREIIDKLLHTSVPLSEISYVRTGTMGFQYWEMSSIIQENSKVTNKVRRLLTPGLIDRYQILWENQEVQLFNKKVTKPTIKYDPEKIDKNTWDLFLSPKIVVRGVASRLSAAWDKSGYGLLVAVHSIQSMSNYTPFFLMAIINSRLCNWYHIIKYYSARIPEGSLRYPISFLKSIPIPKINFVSDLFYKKSVFDDLINSFKNNQHGRIIYNLKEFLSLDNIEDKLIEFGHIIHDLLGYLSKETIQMREEMQHISDCFFTSVKDVVSEREFHLLNSTGKWELSLSRSSACRPFVNSESRTTVNLDDSLGWNEEAFVAFAGMLIGNSKVTPKMVEVYRKYHPEYKALVQKIEATDNLIDQIVYRLYGLTEEEIAVVEGEE